MYDNSNKIGNIGEAIAIAEFTKRGIPILLPFRQNSPYNLAIQLNTRLFKVQCITTEKINNGVMKFEICRKNGFNGKRIIYTNTEIDFFFLYCIENQYIGLLPISEAGNRIQFDMRVSPPLNNQKIGINMWYDYLLDKKLWTISLTDKTNYYKNN